MKKPKIAIIGLTGESVFMEVDEFHLPGETKVCHSFHIEPGGKGFNQAVAVKRLGGEAYFLSAIGNDYYGQVCSSFLENEGVKSSLIMKKQRTAYANILTNKKGDNQVTVYPGAQLSIDDFANFKDIILNCDCLLLQCEVPLEIITEAITIANQKNIFVILNPAPVNKQIINFIDKVSMITPNEVEYYTISKENVDIKQAVITLGSKGAKIIDNSTIIDVPAINTEVVDTTGAGDVFNAALAVKIAMGENIENATKFAVTASGLSVSKKYVMPSIPYLNDIKE